jgi:hypothetical protein
MAALRFAADAAKSTKAAQQTLAALCASARFADEAGFRLKLRR